MVGVILRLLVKACDREMVDSFEIEKEKFRVSHSQDYAFDFFCFVCS